MNALLAFDPDPDKANICFAIAWLVLWFIGLGILIFVKPASLLTRLAAAGVIAVGFIPLGWMWIV